MFPREDFLPPLVRFSNLFYRNSQGWAQEEDVETARERLSQSLTELKARLAWDLPLLSAFEEGPSAAARVGATLELLESAVQQADAETFGFVYTTAQDDFLSAMNEAGNLRDALPVFTDVRIVNELLLLATAHLAERIGAEPLQQRLPILIDWVERKSVDWKTLVRLYPDQGPLDVSVQGALDAMRAGMGGVHLFLAGEESGGLKEGLDIILQALKGGLAPAEETRYLVESERVEFSPDLNLERVWRSADWNDWETTSVPAYLLEFYQENIKRAFRLAQQTLMPGSVLEEKMVAAEQLQMRLVQALEALMTQQTVPEGQPARPPRAQALAELEACRSELESQFEDITEFVEEQRPLEVIPLYANLVGAMVGILNETTPDSQLHSLVDLAVKSQAGFMETVERSAQDMENSSPEQQEALEKSWEALGQQGPVYELLWEYLQNGDRLALHEAYEAISEPFAALAAYAVPEETAPEEPVSVTCPFCRETVVLEAGKCPECRRMVDLNAAENVSTVTITTEGPTSSGLIASLDQRTASLQPGEPRDAVIAEWKALAARLESLSKSAARDGIAGAEGIIAWLVGTCYEVADGLNSNGFNYSSVRGTLMGQFKQLEQSAKNAD